MERDLTRSPVPLVSLTMSARGCVRFCSEDFEKAISRSDDEPNSNLREAKAEGAIY
jgi:hypothetical protein